VFGDDGLIERHAIKQRQARVEERGTTLEAENAKLRDEIRRLR
jgi:cell division protein FtsB